MTEKNVGQETRCVVNKEQGSNWNNVDVDKQGVPCLSYEEIKEIAKFALSLEEKIGCVQDMEWAIDLDFPFPQNIFHLQTRPAKVQAKKSASTTDRIVDLIARRFQKR